jgi:rod shape-determining protein MreC
VALVAQVGREPGQPFAKVIATPTARLDRTREVLLVWTLPHDMLDEAVTVNEADEGARPE